MLNKLTQPCSMTVITFVINKRSTLIDSNDGKQVQNASPQVEPSYRVKAKDILSETYPLKPAKSSHGETRALISEAVYFGTNQYST